MSQEKYKNAKYFKMRQFIFNLLVTSYFINPKLLFKTLLYNKKKNILERNCEICLEVGNLI